MSVIVKNAGSRPRPSETTRNEGGKKRRWGREIERTLRKSKGVNKREGEKAGKIGTSFQKKGEGKKAGGSSTL